MLVECYAMFCYLLFLFGGCVLAQDNDQRRGSSPHCGPQVQLLKQDSRKRLLDALGEVSPTVTKIPLERLEAVGKAGTNNCADIYNYPGDPQAKRSTEMRAMEFWKYKLDEIIQPYLDNPEKYQDLVIDHAKILPNPTHNTSAAYKKLEKQIEKDAKTETDKMKIAVLDRMKNYGTVGLDGLTQLAWRKVEIKRILDDAVFTYNLIAGGAKVWAANGENDVIATMIEAGDIVTRDFYRKLKSILEGNDLFFT